MNAIKFFILVTFIALNQLAFGQDAGIFESQQQRFDAQTTQNTAALETLLADELIYIHSNTLTETKSDFIASVASGKIVYQSMNVQHNKLRKYKKIAVITGLVEVKGLYEGHEFTVELFYTSIYKKHKRNWLLVSWQSTSEK